MNAVAPSCRFYAVEVVRFTGNNLSAFEARTVQRPTAATRVSGPVALTNELDFLANIDDEHYRTALQEFFEACRGLHYRFEWGALGTPIRLSTPFRSEPITVAWVFPPGKSGWMGLRDVALGYDQYSADNAVGSEPHLAWYLERASSLPGSVPVRPGTVRTCQFRPQAFLAVAEDIVALMGELSARVQD